jgi:hypothetical protein
MKKIIFYSIVWALIFGCIACEDEVELNLKDAPPVVVIDAWINNKAEDQKIVLTRSQPYFDNGLPQGISGATVVVTDDLGNTFNFTEESPGEYIWSYEGTTLGEVGRTFSLEIASEGNVYQAASAMRRVPEVDSVVFTFREEGDAFREQGYYGEFVATDLPGAGDTYWIKAYKNDTLLLRPFEINIASDAGFSSGGTIDGVVFIQPIQDAVNPLNDELDAVIPYEPGDSLYVEIHSITVEAFDFLGQLAIQTQRDGGFDEIFAEPLENLPTNITLVSGPSEEPVVGFFSVSAVESNGRKLE